MRDFLLVVHILAAAAWIGGSLFAGYSFSFLAAIRDLKTVKSVEEGTGGKFFGTAVVLMFLSGAALVMISDRFGWGHAFVLIGIGAIAVEGILEGQSSDRGSGASQRTSRTTSRDFAGSSQ
jgi:uncharacterized membrane protein